jgi:hypothetical protein
MIVPTTQTIRSEDHRAFADVIPAKLFLVASRCKPTIDCEEDRNLRALLVGLLREGDRNT